MTRYLSQPHSRYVFLFSFSCKKNLLGDCGARRTPRQLGHINDGMGARFRGLYGSVLVQGDLLFSNHNHAEAKSFFSSKQQKLIDYTIGEISSYPTASVLQGMGAYNNVQFRTRRYERG